MRSPNSRIFVSISRDVTSTSPTSDVTSATALQFRFCPVPGRYHSVRGDRAAKPALIPTSFWVTWAARSARLARLREFDSNQAQGLCFAGCLTGEEVSALLTADASAWGPKYPRRGSGLVVPDLPGRDKLLRYERGSHSWCAISTPPGMGSPGGTWYPGPRRCSLVRRPPPTQAPGSRMLRLRVAAGPTRQPLPTVVWPSMVNPLPMIAFPLPAPRPSK